MKDSEILGGRRKALENYFFEKHEHELIEKLKKEAENKKVETELIKKLNVSSALAAKIVHAGFNLETLAVLTLVPLIEVAWADGILDFNEKKIILTQAKIDHISQELLLPWVESGPSQELCQLWEAYVQTLKEHMEQADWVQFKEGILEHSKRVAEASGGILGLIGSVSKAEKDVLNRIEKVFA